MRCQPHGSAGYRGPTVHVGLWWLRPPGTQHGGAYGLPHSCYSSPLACAAYTRCLSALLPRAPLNHPLSQKDEKLPRIVGLFALPHQRASSIAAGGTCSLALSTHKQLYFWGQVKVSRHAMRRPILRLVSSFLLTELLTHAILYCG